MCRFLPAPSVRRATFAVFEKLRNLTISIHALREEGDPLCLLHRHREGEFLSTPSARRATQRCDTIYRAEDDFYPRPPRGGRPLSSRPYRSATKFLSTPSARRATRDPRRRSGGPGISIHALREEGDEMCQTRALDGRQFLSTPSARRATHRVLGKDLVAVPISIHALREEGDMVAEISKDRVTISIHALREEGDFSCCDRLTRASYFYPRPPRGGRLVTAAAKSGILIFLSTPSARRATARCAAASARWS